MEARVKSINFNFQKFVGFLFTLLIFSYFLGPRYETPLGSGRIEDLLILIFILLSPFMFFVRLHSSSRISLNQETWLILIFLLYVTFLTLIGIIFNHHDHKALVYYFRYIEFFVISFLIIFLFSEKKLWDLLKTPFLISIILSLAWFLYQLITWDFRTFFQSFEVASYGVMGVGEAHPYSLGAIYGYSLVLLYVSLRFRFKLSLFILSSMLFIALVMTLSRASVLSIVITILLMEFTFFKKGLFIRMTSLLGGISLLILAAVLYISYLEIDLPFFRFELEAMIIALQDSRFENIWKPLFVEAGEIYFLGGGSGYISYAKEGADEAHSYYLRLLLEFGFVGLCFFIAICHLAVLKTSQLVKNYSISIECKKRYISYAGVVIFGLIMSLTQEGVYSIKIAIPFFMALGLIFSRRVSEERKF